MYEFFSWNQIIANTSTLAIKLKSLNIDSAESVATKFDEMPYERIRVEIGSEES